MTAFTVETEHHVVEFDVEEQLFPEVDDVVINNLMEDADDARGHYEEIDDEE